MRSFRILAALPLVLAACVTPTRAEVDGPLGVDVLVGGVPLRELAARGNLYVQAERHREYSIRLTNREHRRLAVRSLEAASSALHASSMRAASTSSQSVS